MTHRETFTSHTTRFSTVGAIGRVQNRRLTSPQFPGSRPEGIPVLSLPCPRLSSHLPQVPPTLQARDLSPQPELDYNRSILFSELYTITLISKTSVKNFSNFPSHCKGTLGLWNTVATSKQHGNFSPKCGANIEPGRAARLPWVTV